jgi:hypothetical protein
MVESDKTTQYKFRYVFDVYIYGKDKIRFKTPPNPEGKGLIDVSTLVQSELQIPKNLPFLSQTPFYSGDYLATTVYIKVGEEYATTPTGTPVLYNGSGLVGEPAYGLYADGDWRPAPNATTPVAAWASAKSATQYYDYYATSGEAILDYEMGLGGITPDTAGKFLTNCPLSPQQIRSDEDFTLTWLNRNYEAGSTGKIFPYAMRQKLYKNGSFVGYNDTIATAANGGVWPTCSTLPYASTGASGPTNFLYSFKTNPADIGTVVKDQEVLFGPSYYGCYAQPLGDIFPGYHNSGLSPASNPNIVLNNEDPYIQPQFNSNCTTGFGVAATGWSDLAYRDMTVNVGDVITIEIPSINAAAGTFPSMYLWGSTGPSSNPAKWEQIKSFTAISAGTYKKYILTHTATKAYTALGLRWFAGTSVSCGKFGCFSNVWNITTTIAPDGFDKICMSLQSYSDLSSCTVGATAMSETVCLEINDTNCWGFEPIRFTWINPLGGRDWYTFIKRNTHVQQAARTTLYKLPGYWSAATYSNLDNQPARFGATPFRIDLVNTWTASTDWITEEESAWLREMFASPSVAAYLPGRSTPMQVIIQDAEYSVQTYAREKLFQYFVSFVESAPGNTQGY